MAEKTSWYALKIFYNKVIALKTRLEELGFECYCALDADGKPAVSQLLFVRCTESQLTGYSRIAPQDIKFVAYTRKEQRASQLDEKLIEMDVPAPIPENEMRAFILVTSASPDTYEVLGPDHPKYHTRQKVRVTEGPFAGSEGYVRRIKKDRRLVITVTGIVAVATVYIDPAYLEPVNDETENDK